MKPMLALCLGLAGLPLFADQTLFFLDNDLTPVPITVPDPGRLDDPAVSSLAEHDFLQFQALCDDDPLPGPLTYVARAAWSRYAILGYGFPGSWTARDVREVFLTCDELRSFMMAHYEGQTAGPTQVGSYRAEM